MKCCLKLNREEGVMRELDYVKPDELVIVGLDTDDGEDHPLWDERITLPIDEALVRSVMVIGVKVPVLVRQEDSKWLVVDGRQRVRAARRAAEVETSPFGIKVPIVVQQGDDRAMSTLMVTTNELRQEDGVLTKARKAVRLLGKLGDLEEVALSFGRTPVTISNWLKLAKAHPDIHAAIEAGKISAAAGVELAKMESRDEQKEKLDKMLTAAAQGGQRDPSKEAAVEAMTGEVLKPISEAQVKKEREESGDRKEQRGIKRTWLKKALKTDAADKLDEDQRRVLEWFVTGEGDDKDWFENFRWDAEAELDHK